MEKSINFYIDNEKKNNGFTKNETCIINLMPHIAVMKNMKKYDLGELYVLLSRDSLFSAIDDTCIFNIYLLPRHVVGKTKAVFEDF